LITGVFHFNKGSIPLINPKEIEFLDCIAMEQHKIIEHDKIWRALKVSPTYGRAQVLKILLNRAQEFSIDDICDEKEKYNLTLSKTAVSSIMRLFHVRGLLVQSGERKGPARGRPELLFKISPTFRDLDPRHCYPQS
jgi:hypothetical protein